MAQIIVDENILKKYIEKSLKYDALIEYGVNSWCGFYDALDTYKNEESDLDSDSGYKIFDYSDLIDKEIEFLKTICVN